MNFMDSDIHIVEVVHPVRYRINWFGVIGLGLLLASAAGVIAFVRWLI